MNAKELFVFCIITRFIIVYLAFISPQNIFLRSFSFTISIGFAYYFFSGTRTIGPETFGKPIWWNKLRPIHSFNYLCYLILSFYNPQIAYLPLLFDVVIGVIASCCHGIK